MRLPAASRPIRTNAADSRISARVGICKLNSIAVNLIVHQVGRSNWILVPNLAQHYGGLHEQQADSIGSLRVTGPPLAGATPSCSSISPSCRKPPWPTSLRPRSACLSTRSARPARSIFRLRTVNLTVPDMIVHEGGVAITPWLCLSSRRPGFPASRARGQ
jgi:hypothetical protein